MELTSSVHYDVIYFHLIVTAQFLNSVRAAKSIKIIDFTDAMSLYLTRYLNFITNPIKKLIYKIELMRTSKYERIASKFDTLFVCSDRDKEYLMNKHIHMNTQILLNGVDTQTFRFKENTPEPNRIIFVGNMNYFPNIDAVKFFINEIFPIILKKKPEAKFYIIGPNPPGEILKLQQPNIIFKGFVNDLNNEYLLSSVNVVPVRLGAGIPNKIIEALVLGIPTVSSTLSASGLPGELKNLVLTADDSELFAEKVLDLFENNSFRADLINNGVSKVENLLSWTNIVTNFENYLKNRIQLTNGL
jgi:glycosyltransferase involved in cell wall biosynthesis